MRRILSIFICISYIDPAESVRIKRADPVPWHTLVQLNRIIEAGNTRALDIEKYTKEAAVRQNQQNALLASSASVLSPMAALAMSNNRFSPPDIVPLLRGGNNHDLLPKYTARSRILDNADLIADRQFLFGNDPPPVFALRDIPPMFPPPLMPPPLMPQPVILPRMFQPRMRGGGMGVVETPLALDEPTTRIFPRPQRRTDEEPREKLPTRMRADEFRRKDYIEYVFI